MEYLESNVGRRPLYSIILLDWNVRESFHSLHYLNNQNFPRDKYEIIWVEFYQRKPTPLVEAQTRRSQSRDYFVDKWVILGHSPDTYYHKHFMYNVGLVVADGSICIISDSDAVYPRTFLSSVHNAFKADRNRVVHLDEIRSEHRRFHPFNYPHIDEVLRAGNIHNWTGTTTIGLNDSPDMLHDANYGACMCALREDLIRIGGADEHIEYLGHICGPHEMTFRLVNDGKREHWLKHEFLLHTWHPGQAGRKNYGGPHDGRNVSLRTIRLLKNGRVMPWVENPVIRELRQAQLGQSPHRGDDHANRVSGKTKRELLEMLVEPDREAWKHPEKYLEALDPTQLVEEGYQGRYNILLYEGRYFALPQDGKAFDPKKAGVGAYKLTGQSLAQVKHLIDHGAAVESGTPVAAPAAASVATDDAEPKASLPVATEAATSTPKPTPPPLLVKEGFRRFNIILYDGDYFAICQGEGEFSVDKVAAQQYTICYWADTEQQLEEKLLAEPATRMGQWALRPVRARLVRRIARKLLDPHRWLVGTRRAEQSLAATVTRQKRLIGDSEALARREAAMDTRERRVCDQQRLLEQDKKHLAEQQERLTRERTELAESIKTVQRLHQGLAEESEQLESRRQKIEAAERSLEQAREELANERRHRDEQRAELARCREELDARGQELNRRFAELAFRRHEQQERLAKLARHQAELEARERDLDGRADELASRQHEQQERLAKLTQLQAELEARERELDRRAAAMASGRKQQQQHAELARRQAELDARVAAASEQRELMEQEKRRLAKREKQLRSDRAELASTIAMARDLQEHLAAAREESRRAWQELKSQQQALDLARQKLAEERKRLETSQAPAQPAPPPAPPAPEVTPAELQTLAEQRALVRSLVPANRSGVVTLCPDDGDDEASAELLRQLKGLTFTQNALADNSLLYYCAQAVPENATILEIGTGFGGSAFVFATATRSRKVRIVSVDNHSIPVAKANLQGMNVELVESDSVAFASQWSRRPENEIDLLFIDGGHSLEDVYRDFHAWIPFVRTGGVVIFHDLDLEFDGGTNHLGVRVFLEALLSARALDKTGRSGRCFVGVKPAGRTRTVSLRRCKKALGRLSENICRILDGKANAVRVWPETTARFLQLLGETTQARAFSLPAGRQSFVVVDGSEERIASLIETKGRQVDAYADRLTLLYMLNDWLTNASEQEVLVIAANRNAMLHWREAVSMLSDATARRGFPRNLAALAAAEDIESLSRYVATEQVRLLMLMELEAPGEYL